MSKQRRKLPGKDAQSGAFLSSWSLSPTLIEIMFLVFSTSVSGTCLSYDGGHMKR